MAASPLPMEVILPAIVRLFAAMRSAPVVRGKLIPMSEVSPMNDAEALRKLNEKLKTKKKEGFNDAIWLIKLEEVRKILDEVLSNRNEILEFAKKVASALISSDPGEPILQKTADRIMTRCREECLRHDTPRVRKHKDYSGRPAKGHGYGR
jgi:hypothetical protein